MTARKRQQADTLAQVLAAAGVTDIFTLCGNHLLDAYRGLVDGGINLIGVRSEAAASMAADGYARSTRRLGVALVTGGPGHTNAITGLATADSSASPVLLLSGSSDSRRRGAGAHQELDQVAGVKAYTKWASEVAEAAGLAGDVCEALTNATSAPTGATHLSLPLDLLAAEASDIDIASLLQRTQQEHRPKRPSTEGVAEFHRRLGRAERPVALVGAGAYFEKAEREIADFCRSMSIPIFTLDSARGAIADDDKLCFGYPDIDMNPTASVIARADLVLLFGHRVDFRFAYGAAFPAATGIVEINPDPRQLGVDDDRVLGVVGSTTDVLRGVQNSVPAISRDPSWLRSVQAAAVDLDPTDVDQRDGAVLDPESVARVLGRRMPASAAVALDSGDFVQWCRALLPAGGPGQWLRPGRMSTCGAGLPLAIGAAVGRRQPVVAVVGDGSLGYHIAELETAVRYQLPVLCVVGNNQAWGLELNLQNAIYDERYAAVSTLGTVDYSTVARGFGAEGHHVGDLARLGDLVDDFFARPRPMLIEVPVSLRPSPVTRSIIQRGSV